MTPTFGFSRITCPAKGIDETSNKLFSRRLQNGPSSPRPMRNSLGVITAGSVTDRRGRVFRVEHLSFFIQRHVDRNASSKPRLSSRLGVIRQRQFFCSYQGCGEVNVNENKKKVNAFIGWRNLTRARDKLASAECSRRLFESYQINVGQ
jgi:hypothetical protein